jgi:hypothetical protein
MDRKARNSVLFGPSIHAAPGRDVPLESSAPRATRTATSALSSWSASPAQLGRGPCPASFSPTSRAGVKDGGLFPCEPFSRRHFVGVAGGAGLLAAGLAGADASDALAARCVRRPRTARRAGGRSGTPRSAARGCRLAADPPGRGARCGSGQPLGRRCSRTQRRAVHARPGGWSPR